MYIKMYIKMDVMSTELSKALRKVRLVFGRVRSQGMEQTQFEPTDQKPAEEFYYPQLNLGRRYYQL